MGLKGLTMPRYYVLLALLHPEHRHEEVPENVDFDKGSGGPIFFDFFDMNLNSKKKTKGKKMTKGKKLIFLLNRLLSQLERPNESEPNTCDSAWLENIEKNYPARYKLIARCIKFPESGVVEVARIYPGGKGPYIAAWPLGWPHGAEVTGNKCRVTLNSGLNVYSKTNADFRDRGIERTFHLIC